MKHLLLVACVLWIAYSPEFVIAEPATFEVRGHHWGDTVERVTSLEGETPLKKKMASSVMLLFLDHEILFDQTFTIGFSFFQDKLYGVSYMEKGKKCGEVKKSIEEIAEELLRKYKTPVKHDKGATCTQHAEWKWGETQIRLNVETDTLEDVDISLTYRHMPSVEKVREADKELSKSKL